MSWVLANLPTIAGHLLAHLLQAVPAILAAFVLSIPIARLARAARPLRAVLVTGSSLLYAIPSLALFVTVPLMAPLYALAALQARGAWPAAGLQPNRVQALTLKPSVLPRAGLFTSMP